MCSCGASSSPSSGSFAICVGIARSCFIRYREPVGLMRHSANESRRRWRPESPVVCSRLWSWMAGLPLRLESRRRAAEANAATAEPLVRSDT